MCCTGEELYHKKMNEQLCLLFGSIIGRKAIEKLAFMVLCLILIVYLLYIVSILLRQHVLPASEQSIVLHLKFCIKQILNSVVCLQLLGYCSFPVVLTKRKRCCICSLTGDQIDISKRLHLKLSFIGLITSNLSSKKKKKSLPISLRTSSSCSSLSRDNRN